MLYSTFPAFAALALSAQAADINNTNSDRAPIPDDQIINISDAQIKTCFNAIEFQTGVAPYSILSKGGSTENDVYCSMKFDHQNPDDAIRVTSLIQKGQQFIKIMILMDLDIDIPNNSVSHTITMEQIEVKISDDNLCALTPNKDDENKVDLMCDEPIVADMTDVSRTFGQALNNTAGLSTIKAKSLAVPTAQIIVAQQQQQPQP